MVSLPGGPAAVNAVKGGRVPGCAHFVPIVDESIVGTATEAAARLDAVRRAGCEHDAVRVAAAGGFVVFSCPLCCDGGA